MAQTMTEAAETCYLCGQPVDSSESSADHVIPRTLRGKGPPKVRGFDYGGVLPTYPECNNRFGDETHVRKALQLLGALYDSNTTLARLCLRPTRHVWRWVADSARPPNSPHRAALRPSDWSPLARTTDADLKCEPIQNLAQV